MSQFDPTSNTNEPITETVSDQLSPSQLPVAEHESSVLTDTVKPVAHAVGISKNSFFRKRLQMIMGLVFLVLVAVGGVAAYMLSQTSQDLRQQAAGTTYIKCVIGVSGCPKDYACVNKICVPQRFKTCTGENKQEFSSEKCCPGLVLTRVDNCPLKLKIINRCPPVEGGYRECRKP